MDNIQFTFQDSFNNTFFVKLKVSSFVPSSRERWPAYEKVRNPSGGDNMAHNENEDDPEDTASENEGNPKKKCL